MHKLNLPAYDFKLKKRDDQLLVWDEIRMKDIVLTPEEWIRQHFIKYLNLEYGYPKGLMKVEGGHKYNKKQMRSDILCYNSVGKMVLLVECKRPRIKITQKTFDQIARYNMTLKVPLLAVTNGIDHLFCKIDFEKKQYSFLPNLPHYNLVKELL